MTTQSRAYGDDESLVYTTTELAGLLKCSREHLRRHLAELPFPYIQLGNKIVISKKAVDEHLGGRS